MLTRILVRVEQLLVHRLSRPDSREISLLLVLSSRGCFTFLLRTGFILFKLNGNNPLCFNFVIFFYIKV